MYRFLLVIWVNWVCVGFLKLLNHALFSEDYTKFATHLRWKKDEFNPYCA